MNSKSRAMETINFREPDRVPLGEWGIDHDHVSRILGHHTYWRNRKDTTIALWEGRRDEVVDSLKEDSVALVKALDYDIVTVYLVPPKDYFTEDPPKKKGEGIWEDSKGNRYKYAASNDSIMFMGKSPEKDQLSEEDIQTANKRAEDIDETVFELVDHVYEKFKDEKIILFRDIDIYGFMTSPFGGDFNHKLLISAFSSGEIKKMENPCIEYNKALLKRCKEKNVSIAMYGHDYCMNTGCMISPAAIREIYFPCMNKINDEIIKMGMLPFFHCCGNTWSILDDFVKSGYKGYQSVQKSAGMEWKKLKDMYYGKLVLWAGIQCETLTSGSLEETKNEVLTALKELMPGGGFIFGSTNSVQYGAKTDNYLKALETLRKFGEYK